MLLWHRQIIKKIAAFMLWYHAYSKLYQSSLLVLHPSKKKKREKSMDLSSFFFFLFVFFALPRPSPPLEVIKGWFWVRAETHSWKEKSGSRIRNDMAKVGSEREREGGENTVCWKKREVLFNNSEISDFQLCLAVGLPLLLAGVCLGQQQRATYFEAPPGVSTAEECKAYWQTNPEVASTSSALFTRPAATQVSLRETGEGERERDAKDLTTGSVVLLLQTVDLCVHFLSRNIWRHDPGLQVGEQGRGGREREGGRGPPRTLFCFIFYFIFNFVGQLPRRLLRVDLVRLAQGPPEGAAQALARVVLRSRRQLLEHPRRRSHSVDLFQRGENNNCYYYILQNIISQGFFWVFLDALQFPTFFSRPHPFFYHCACAAVQPVHGVHASGGPERRGDRRLRLEARPGERGLPQLRRPRGQVLPVQHRVRRGLPV